MHGYTFANSKDLKRASVKRELFSSKNTNGRILIVGGSTTYHGAPAQAALAALRTGAGYVVNCVPRGIVREVRSVSANTIVMPLKGNIISMKDIPMLIDRLDRSGCLVIGPGLGRDTRASKPAMKLFEYCMANGKMLVIDADALRILANSRKKLNKKCIVTPNRHELLMFYDKKIDDKDTNSRISAAIAVSKRLNACVLLKGHTPIVTDGKKVKVIKSRSAALATMGTGDVLTGIVGAYAAKTGDSFLAAVAGAYLQATIGDALHAKMGNHIIASDVVDYIPKVLKKIDK